MYALELGRSTPYHLICEEVVKDYAQGGIRVIEYSFARLEIDFNAQEIVDKVDSDLQCFARYGIEPVSVHLPFGIPWNLCVPDDVIRNHAMDEYARLLEILKRVHVKRYVLHPGTQNVPQQERTRRIELFKDNVARLAKLAVPAHIAVENMARDCLGNTSAELMEMVDGKDNITVCCDMNHWLLENNYDAIYALGSRIETLHVSDYDGIEEKHWLPGKGNINWNQVIEALKHTGYHGPFIYECSNDFLGIQIRENFEMLFSNYHNAVCAQQAL